MAAIAASSVLALGWASGCSVLYELETKQCSVDADCAALGGVFAELACVENLCQAPPVTGCQTNAECIDEFGQTFEPWACIEQPPDGLRRVRECVQLTTTECPTMLPLGADDDLYVQILRSENPLILAGTGLIGGTETQDARMRNYDLALRQLDDTYNGLPSGRRVAMIGCGSLFEDDETALDREFDHLMNEVKVPGIVSSYLAEDLQRAFTEYGRATQTFFMSALESDATLGAIPDENLIWHIGPGVDVIARAYAPLFTRTLAHLGIAGRTDVKVASVVTNDIRFLSNMAPAIEQPPEQYGLAFNGKTVTENGTDGNYITVGINSAATSDISTQLDRILALRPNVIVSVADQQFVLRIMTAVESEWPTDGTPKPFYLLSPFNFGHDALVSMLQSDPSLQTRIAGVNGSGGPNPDLRAAYVRAFTRTFGEAYPNDVNFENFYDAAYYMLYAAAAAGSIIDNGLSLRAGFNRLLSGALSFDVGTGDMPEAMGVLASPSTTIQLNGVLGPPDWNPINGTRRSYGSVWCIDPSGTYQPDVLTYVPNDTNPAQASLDGTFPCFDFEPAVAP